jgi:hypothetical protein
MNAARLALVAVAFAAIPMSGCGTFCNLASRDPELYGGVKKDFEFLAAAKPASSEGGDPRGLLIALGIWGADVACSFAADTLTIPVIRRWEAIRSRERESSKVPLPPSASAGQPGVTQTNP